jgi:hypothetical protein
MNEKDAGIVLERLVELMERPKPERRLPSASNADLRAHCVCAWALIETLETEGRLSRETNQAALDGTAIHAARETGEAALAEDLIKTKTLLDEMEQKLVADWDPDPVLIGRETRLWLRHGITPIHTGRYDYAYRSQDWARILIADDKTGRLEVTAAEVNDQMRELAALVYFNYPSVQEITVAICQPWVSRTPSVAFYGKREAELALLLLKKNLGDIADPYAIRTPGRHCTYCPAALHCEENHVLVNSVYSVSERVKRGEYELPLGQSGSVFLDRMLMAQKVIETIITRYKNLLTTDPNSVPGYYLKAGNYRHVITDPFGVMKATEIPLEEFIWCGKFSLPVTDVDRSAEPQRFDQTGVNRMMNGRTPEQEAFRLARLREAMKKPRSASWKQHQSEGIRKALAEGRLPVKRSALSIERGAAKLRGRKRPLEVVEKVRLANLGQKRSAETKANFSERMRQEFRDGKRVITPEQRAKFLEIAKRGRVISEQQRRHHSEMLRGRKSKPEHIEKRVGPMRGRPQRAELTKIGPTNHGSIEGVLRSPENKLYPFRNLTHFVREHPQLFFPEDVVWKKRDRAFQCRASHALLRLFGHGKVVPGTWKGWTRYSWVEHTFNAGDDLLRRPVPELVE